MNATPNIEDIINPNDFQSISIQFKWLKNITARTEVNSPDSATITSFGEKNLTIDLPSGSGAQGHKLMFEISVNEPGVGEKWSFDATAKIDAVESTGDDRQSYELTLIQFEEKSWNRLLNIYHKRQTEILEFFKAVKG